MLKKKTCYFCFAKILLVSQKQNGNTWKEKAFIKLTEISEFNNISYSQFSMILRKPSNLGKLTPHKALEPYALLVLRGVRGQVLGARGEGCREAGVR